MANGLLVADKFSKLPELAKPSLYELRLAPCLKTFKFKGQQKIHLEITKQTNYLKLHSNGLDVERVSLNLANGTVLPDLKKEIDNKWKLLTLYFPEEIQPQKAQLDFVFNGELCSQLEGFYRSPYKDLDGKQKFMASTQFESVNARRAFPCFDEPIYKAQFDVKLEVAENLTALSNMNVVEESNTGNGTKLITFARTPPMSTYLVAFAIGDFEYIEDKTKDGCVVRVYTLPGKKEKAKYALEVGKKAIDWYSDWFGIKMPLPKCDMIGIPEFSMGAMENWGLITYREAYILFDPSLTSSALKERITLVIAHEVGHFWFGNLVTMKWWNDLWLKEGFASFMEYVFTAYNYPEFKIWFDFVSTEVVNAMQLDSLRNSHPIEVPIDNPNELDEIYDSITYAKSNSIIRMLFSTLGEPIFQKGLRTYLNKHKYSNAITEDLWKALSDSSEIDVASMMSTWTKQTGFPLVTVNEKQLSGDKREIQLKQTRFLADGDVLVDDSNPCWHVPIAVICASDPLKPIAKFLLTKPEDTFIVEGIKSTEWIKLNSQFTSFYRVCYSNEMLKKLLEGVRNREIDVLDRFQICNDLFAIIKAGHLPITQFLEFLAVCKEEDNLFVWESIDGSIAEIDHVLTHLNDGGKLKSRFHQFICKIIEPVAAGYGWESRPGEDMQTSKLRALLINRLARSQHQPTIQIAMAKFTDHVNLGEKLDPDLRTTIFSTAARTNNKEVVSDLQKILTTCNFSEIERSCISALGQCSAELLPQIYEHGITSKNMKNQDIIYLLIGAKFSGLSTSQHFAWKYFKDNLKMFLELYGSPNDGLFQHCFKAVTKSFCSSKNADDVENFCKQNFDENSLKTLDRPIRQILETIKLNERLLTENSESLHEYLVKADI